MCQVAEAGGERVVSGAAAARPATLDPAQSRLAPPGPARPPHADNEGWLSIPSFLSSRGHYPPDGRRGEGLTGWRGRKEQLVRHKGGSGGQGEEQVMRQVMRVVTSSWRGEGRRGGAQEQRGVPVKHQNTAQAASTAARTVSVFAQKHRRSASCHQMGGLSSLSAGWWRCPPSPHHSPGEKRILCGIQTLLIYKFIRGVVICNRAATQATKNRWAVYGNVTVK
ncbi:hypothetical protein O3P69_002185 [Scylla paramamosain]|uniref:Uncharacterized protein n=1 Tax=Scylla paramamosain TaxID=85552 RepID=A0AAW0V697_SCYPA